MVKIYIDNTEIDLDENLTLSNNYSIEAINNLEESKDCNTKTLSAPDTKKNRLVFGFPGDINIVNIFNKNNHYGIIEEEGTRTIKGKVKLLSVTGIPGQQRYEFYIVGNSKVWIDYFKNHKLNELDFPGQHDYKKTVIEAVADGSQPYIYPLINFRQNIRPGATNLTGVLVEDFDPFLFAYPILKGCYEKIGYTLNSDFVESDFFRRLIFSARIPKKTPECIKQRLFKVGLWKNEPMLQLGYSFFFNNENNVNFYGNTTENHDENNLFVNGYFYGGNINCSTRFHCKLRFQKFYEYPATDDGFSSYPYDVYVFLVKKSNDPITGYDVLQTKRYFFPADSQQNFGQPFDIHAEFDSIVPDPNDRIGIAIYFSEPGVSIYSDPVNTGQYTLQPNPAYNSDTSSPYYNVSVPEYISTPVIIPGQPIGIRPFMITDFTNIGFTLMAEGTEFYNEIVEYPEEGDHILNKDLLPEWTMIDFLKSLKQLFNLKILTDIENRVVYIEPRDTFYLQNIVDLSQKLDISQSVIISDLLDDIAKEIHFRYKNDEKDTNVQDLNKSNGDILAEYVTYNDSVHSTGEDISENNIFSPTLMDHSVNIGFITGKLPSIISTGRTRDYAPRILYFDGVKQCLSGDKWKFEGEDKEWYSCAYSLGEHSLFFNSKDGYKGLYERFYKKTIRTINESKRIKASFFIDATFVNNFVNIDDNQKKDFRARFFIRYNAEGIFCRLEEITDYDSSGNSTKITLIKEIL